ncbi:MAG: sugar phosphate isomerase/epimerase [Bacillota bacterium]|nr:sugar phosphate isomerase/epimerase [Bacillota bacterium]
MSDIKVGLQLYSIRDFMEKDMDETLKQVKEIGYDYVEFAGFFGKSAEEVKALLKKHGLEVASVHQGLQPFLEGGNAIIDYLAELGTKYCAIPWYERAKLEKGTPVWDETTKNFTAYGKALKDKGIKMLYHNHDFEMDVIDGKCILDWIYESISADLLEPQFDTCWVRYGGYDPVEYIEKYKGRVEIIHLKDFTCKKLGGGPVYALIDGTGKEGKKPTREENEFKFQPLGMGMQDFPAILQAAKNVGVKCVIVEQDQSLDRSSLEAAKISREYLRSLGL